MSINHSSRRVASSLARSMAAETIPPTLLAHGVDASRDVIAQGAEARVYGVDFLNRACVVKHRFRKAYRLPVLDEKLTRSRLAGEARAMVRARRAGVRAPCVVHVDAARGCVYSERVEGRTLKETLRRRRETSDGNDAEGEREALKTYGRDIGEQIAKLHDAGIVHGDLTTSNFMVRDADGKVVVVDFGLSYPSDAAEDKGVDLYVLERAITAAHPSQTFLFDVIIDTYEKKSKMWCATLNRFAEVRARGRKRSMVG